MFITPVSMPCTESQYKEFLEKPLKEMGYATYKMWENCDEKYICTNFGHNALMITTHISHLYRGRYCIPEFNPDLFLALAAMTDSSDGVPGEYWKIMEGGVNCFTKNKIYKQVDKLTELCPFIDDEGEENGYLCNYEHFVKATKEEIINHFKPTKMKKEILIPQGAKLTIEYDDHSGMFKKGDFVHWNETFNGNHGIVIIKEDCACDDELPYFVHLGGRNEIYFNLSIGIPHREQRIATGKEMEKLLCALRKTGKDWDFEKMELVNIKEKFVPKPGDVCNSGDGAIYIFKKDEGGSHSRFYAAYFKKEIFIDRTVTDISRRLATREERCVFFEELTKEGYKWDSKKMVLKKIEEVFVPREGDFCISTGGGVCIYHAYGAFFYEGILFTPEVRRLATASEKQFLLDAMHSEGKDWDAVNKKVVDYKWKPKYGETYFIADPTVRNFCAECEWEDDQLDSIYFDRNLIRKTKEEAISRAKQMLKK